MADYGPDHSRSGAHLEVAGVRGGRPEHWSEPLEHYLATSVPEPNWCRHRVSDPDRAIRDSRRVISQFSRSRHSSAFGQLGFVAEGCLRSPAKEVKNDT